MNWREFITTGLTHAEDTSFAFHAPAAEAALAYLKECFGLTELPTELEKPCTGKQMGWTSGTLSV